MSVVIFIEEAEGTKDFRRKPSPVKTHRAAMRFARSTAVVALAALPLTGCIIVRPAVPASPAASSSTPSPSPKASSSPTDVYAKGLTGKGTSPESPLPFGTPLVLQSASTGRDALQFTVNNAIDVTAAARAASITPPKNGAYLAVPIKSREIDVKAISDSTGNVNYPPSQWSSSGGGYYYPTPNLEIPGYPSIDTAQPTTDSTGVDTYQYYEIYDVAAQDITNGRYAMLLTQPDGTHQVVWWG